MPHIRIVARALIGATVVALLAVTLAAPQAAPARLAPTLGAASSDPGVAFHPTAMPSQLVTATAKRADAEPNPKPTPKPTRPPVSDVRAARAAESPSSAGQPVRRVASTRAVSKLERARMLLAQHVRTHPLLAGTTIEIGYAQGYQAVSYYRSGRIVVSPTHTASLERIVAHEIWHVIDWRDNGRIDWGENLPPMNASKYYTGPR